MLACQEASFVSSWNAEGESRLSIPQRLENLKKDRLAITEILLHAGSKCKHSSLQDADSLGDDGCDKILRWWALDENLSSGGPEVLELISLTRPQPRTLLSSCRVAVRRCLSRPILLSQNVRMLPLPDPLRQYVAMETLGFSLTEPYWHW